MAPGLQSRRSSLHRRENAHRTLAEPSGTAILAAAPGEYAAYTAAIREEYAAVPEAAFVAARLEIMSPLIEGDIFRTTKGRALTEAARVNVTAECAELRQRLEQLVAGSPP